MFYFAKLSLAREPDSPLERSMDKDQDDIYTLDSVDAGILYELQLNARGITHEEISDQALSISSRPKPCPWTSGARINHRRRAPSPSGGCPSMAIEP